jgi:hypothetical protein
MPIDGLEQLLGPHSIWYFIQRTLDTIILLLTIGYEVRRAEVLLSVYREL